MSADRDDQIELDMDLLSRKTLWALHELDMKMTGGKAGLPRKGEGSGTPGVATGGPQESMANQHEVCVHQLAMRVSIVCAAACVS